MNSITLADLMNDGLSFISGFGSLASESLGFKIIIVFAFTGILLGHLRVLFR